jgi:hypothetical protein
MCYLEPAIYKLKKIMRGKRFVFLIYSGVFLMIIMPWSRANAQVVHIGVKSGLNLSWVRAQDPDFRKDHTVSPVLGFNAGAAFNFNIRERYFLHAEILYATKGRVITGDEELHDKLIYNFIEVPLLYNIFFKGKINATNIKRFKWYVGFGPNVSYWLGGKGTIKHYEIREYDGDPIDYKIKFGERSAVEEGKSDVVYINNANRLQLGLNLGGGILLEPANGGKVMFDLRFELGGSWFARKEGSHDMAFPASYDDELRARSMGLRLSAMYLLEFNTDKKVRNKGKSTKKIRRR